MSWFSYPGVFRRSSMSLIFILFSEGVVCLGFWWRFKPGKTSKQTNCSLQVKFMHSANSVEHFYTNSTLLLRVWCLEGRYFSQKSSVVSVSNTTSWLYVMPWSGFNVIWVLMLQYRLIRDQWPAQQKVNKKSSFFLTLELLFPEDFHWWHSNLLAKTYIWCLAGKFCFW